MCGGWTQVTLWSRWMFCLLKNGTSWPDEKLSRKVWSATSKAYLHFHQTVHKPYFRWICLYLSNLWGGWTESQRQKLMVSRKICPSITIVSRPSRAAIVFMTDTPTQWLLTVSIRPLLVKSNGPWTSTKWKQAIVQMCFTFSPLNHSIVCRQPFAVVKWQQHMHSFES